LFLHAEQPLELQLFCRLQGANFIDSPTVVQARQPTTIRSSIEKLNAHRRKRTIKGLAASGLAEVRLRLDRSASMS
jgi:hypothetical protein